MKEAYIFRERQAFPSWVNLLVWVSALGIAVSNVAAYYAPEEDSLSVTRLSAINIVVIAALVLTINLLSMVTTVYTDRVEVYFGRWFPLYRKRFWRDTIASVREVGYRPLRDAGGWGIRFGRFDGKYCRYLNCRGNRGVLIMLKDESRYILGSQEAENLASALQPL